MRPPRSVAVLHLLRSVKDLNCSEGKRLSTVAYFARIYIPPLFKIAVFGSPAYAYMTLDSLPCHILLITFLSRICDGVLHNYPTTPQCDRGWWLWSSLCLSTRVISVHHRAWHAWHAWRWRTNLEVLVAVSLSLLARWVSRALRPQSVENMAEVHSFHPNEWGRQVFRFGKRIYLRGSSPSPIHQRRAVSGLSSALVRWCMVCWWISLRLPVGNWGTWGAGNLSRDWAEIVPIHRRSSSYPAAITDRALRTLNQSILFGLAVWWTCYNLRKLVRDMRRELGQR